MKKHVLCVTALVLLASATAEAAAIKASVLACKDEAVLKAVSQLRSKGDTKASAAFEGSKLSGGDCVRLAQSASVSIDSRKPPLVCIRLSGGLDCYWTISSAVDEHPPMIGKPSGGSPARGGRRKR
jgi:hypothetical protein